MDVDDYELHARRRRRRFQRLVASVVAALVAAIYGPWALVPARVVSSSVAGAVSVLAGLLFVGAWMGLMMSLVDPNDAPPQTGTGQRGYLMTRLAVAAAIAAGIVAVAIVFFAMGLIGAQGIAATFGLLTLMGLMVVRALVGRALRSLR